MLKDSVIKNDMSKAPKTGDWSFMIPEIDKDKCIGCSSCVPFCPEACIEVESIKYKVESNKEEKQKKIAKVDYDFCKGCGVCSTVCPVKAIIMKKK